MRLDWRIKDARLDSEGTKCSQIEWVPRTLLMGVRFQRKQTEFDTSSKVSSRRKMNLIILFTMKSIEVKVIYDIWSLSYKLHNEKYIIMRSLKNNY